MRLPLSALLLLLAPALLQAEGPPLVLADFEGAGYAGWSAEGTAFGQAPAHGALPGQMPVQGYFGHGLVNSFLGGDRSTGTLTSPEFTIDHAYLSFLIGGGGWAGKTCLNLLVDGQIARTATGPNTAPGGSEALAPGHWDVRDLAGRTARLQIVDAATEGWGHINVDQIALTDQRPAGLRQNATRELTATKQLLHFPVQAGAPKRKVGVLVQGRVERFFDIELAPGEPDWWAPLEIGAWPGQPLTVRVDQLPEDSQALASLDQSDHLKIREPLYHEALRPQLHYSPRRGWMNDPNGLVFAHGEYHLFYQHNPYGTEWGNMHWGHAVSRDLVHWQERVEALYPDDSGPMFSGSAVVDRANTSGLGAGKEPPLVLIYTAAGHPTTQRLAFSVDGGQSFTKYAGNPVLPQITDGNRDPKVWWHAETQRWIMALYVGFPATETASGEKKKKVETIQFYASPDLMRWNYLSQVEDLFECPDIFPLALPGEPGKTLWVLTAASSDYFLGTFDGTTFRPTTPKLKGHQGRGFYAAQTYNDLPREDGRRLQIGWLQAPSPGMPFNQAMSVPLELSLHATPAGPRLAWQPARELQSLRGARTQSDGLRLQPGAANPLAAFHGELVELRAEFTPGSTGEVRFTVRGVPIVYDAAQQEISINEHRAPAPLQEGIQRLTVLADRTAFEVFASDGLTYIPMPVLPKPDARGVEVQATEGAVTFSQLEAYELRSIWAE